MKRIVWFLILLLVPGCAAGPLSKVLNVERQPRLGIIGFKVTAPIKHLSSIVENPSKNPSRKEESSMLAEQLHKIEDQAANFLMEALREEKKVEGVLIAEEGFGTRRGEPPTAAEIETLRKELDLDAVLYGQIPSYGKMPLIYPIVAETIDISTETLIIGVATGWYLPVVLGNVGLELLTNTPLWFGGAYVFGWAFRPVTVEARVLSTADGKEVWHESVDKFSAKKILETYPPSEQSKKEIQLEASLLKAIRSLAKSLSE